MLSSYQGPANLNHPVPIPGIVADTSYAILAGVGEPFYAFEKILNFGG